MIECATEKASLSAEGLSVLAKTQTIRLLGLSSVLGFYLGFTKFHSLIVKPTQDKDASYDYECFNRCRSQQ